MLLTFRYGELVVESFFSLFWNQGKIYRNLAPKNKEMIDQYNHRMLLVLLFIGGVLLLLPLAASPFSKTKMTIVPIYITVSAIYFFLYFLFKKERMEKYSLAGLYVGYIIFFIIGLYLSLIHTPTMRATILLGVFSIASLTFIDHPMRINSFVAFWLILHTVLTFFFKPLYVVDDLINSLFFATIGILFGNILIGVRIVGYETQRLLIIEKETDFLTGLGNRRKLFDTLGNIEEGDKNKPSGILMLDIDNFKGFNDKHGHLVADQYLRKFGFTLKTFSEKYPMDFYRFGGEEFVGLSKIEDKKKLLEVAEEIRLAIEKIKMEEDSITVSIGVSYTTDIDHLDYEELIKDADSAIFVAKRSGKNSVYSN